MHGAERGGVELGDRGGGLQRAGQLPLDRLAGHLDHDGLTGDLVEGEDVDAGDGLGGH